MDVGYVGLGPVQYRLPAELYRFRILAPLGFPDPAFRSSDYFPMLPWYLLFLCGWFLGKLLPQNERLRRLARVKMISRNRAARISRSSAVSYNRSVRLLSP